jgi:flagellar hook protein FlgE
MAISNSLQTGVNATRTFAKNLEVIGDNMANVNTTGFKTARAVNQDAFIQTLKESGTGTTPSTNPIQIGQGTTVGGVLQRFTQGVLSSTGGSTDLGIVGSGFFKVTGNGSEEFYTRAGDFILNKDGDLTTTQGYKVAGVSPITDVDSFRINEDGTIETFKDGVKGSAGTIQLYNVNNPNGLRRESGNLFSLTDASGTASVATQSKIIQGSLELSNVDLTEEFSDLIVAQRGFQAGARIITVSDSVLEEVVNLKR